VANSDEQKPADFVVTFADFRALLRKHRKRIKFCVFCFSMLAILFALCRPILFETKAVFHQKGKSPSGISSDVFQSLFSVNQPDSEGSLL